MIDEGARHVPGDRYENARKPRNRERHDCRSRVRRRHFWRVAGNFEGSYIRRALQTSARRLLVEDVCTSSVPRASESSFSKSRYAFVCKPLSQFTYKHARVFLSTTPMFFSRENPSAFGLRPRYASPCEA